VAPRQPARPGPEQFRRPGPELLYGRNAVREALRAGRRRLRRLLVADGIQQTAPIVELEALADDKAIEVAYGDRRVLDEMTNGANHQGVALEVGPYPYADLDDMLALARERDEPPLLLLLDHLQDPQNVGTLLRTADVAGAHGVVLPGRRAAEVTPAVVNASAGAVEHLLIASVANLGQTIEALKEQGVWVVGLEDDERAQEYDRVELPMPVALVVGAEGPGLARLVRERCDLLIRLPMAGHIASLNAATAGSIALYHMWRARIGNREQGIGEF
jgi:23S rRNA (guanosine2251-2'-O)-methyltransferase